MLEVRSATLADIPEMEKLEQKSWDGIGSPANAEQLASRINTFAEGNILVFGDGGLLAYCCVIIVSKEIAEHEKLTWDMATDGGMIAGTHDPNGSYVYGVNLSAVKNDLGAGHAAVRRGQALCIAHGLRYLVFGARVPGLAAWLKNHAKQIEHYLAKGEDSLLEYFEQFDFYAERMLPDYYPGDPDSLDYGALVRFENPLWGKLGLAEAVSELFRNYRK